MVQSCLPASAEFAAAVRVVWVPLQFDDSTVLYMADDAADGTAQLTHAGNFFRSFVFVWVGPVAFGVGAGKLADAWSFLAACRVIDTLEPLPFVHVDALRRPSLLF